MSEKAPFVSKTRKFETGVKERPLRGAEEPVEEKRESVEEFLARGGEVERLKTRKSKGFISMSKVKSGNTSPSARSRSQSAEAKFSRGIK